MSRPEQSEASAPRPHPRKLGWFGTTALAIDGSSSSLLIMGALFVGQGEIPGQGSVAILLLIVGMFLGWAAAPGWLELVLMNPNRVGGIAASCTDAFRPYSPLLSNLTGVCYWWGYAIACAIGAMLSAGAIHQWYLPWFPVPLLGTCFIVFGTGISLCGLKWVMRLAMPLALGAATLAFLSVIVPAFTGNVDWQRAFTFKLTVPFPGWFGGLTSVMAGLYLIGYTAPAFEHTANYVGETINPNRNVPRAMLTSAALAGFYFIVIPIIWLGALGPEKLALDLALILGPTFAPLVGGAAKATAVWFVVLHTFPGVMIPLASASRTLAQLAEDGLLPEFMSKRSWTDAPWVTTLITASLAVVVLFAGVPLWLIAATNFTYLISISLVSIAVWVLRRDQPDLPRPYRAPRGMIVVGICTAGVWLLTTILGFQQFGLPTVLAGIGFAYSGAILYAWRKAADRRKLGLPLVARSLHVKLTGAMLLVLLLNGAGYYIAVHHVPVHDTALLAVLADIFVAVALLTLAVGLILPGMIAHAAVEVSNAADKLVRGTLTDFTRAMQALAAGDLDAAKARFDFAPVVVRTHDEVGEMALSFNKLQEEIGHAAVGLAGAREGLLTARKISETNVRLRLELAERSQAEERMRAQAALLDKATDAILVGNLDDKVLYLNPSAEALYGWSLAELKGLPGGAPIYKNRAQFETARRTVLKRGDWSGDLAQVTRDGRSLIVESRWTLLRDNAGQPKSILFINTDIAARKSAEAALAQMNSRLQDVSRQAGMAEVATSVLHNVGNVLNSVNISTGLIVEKVQRSRASSLGKVADLLKEHDHDLGEFITSDTRGKHVPAHLAQLSKQLVADQQSMMDELESLHRNVEHIKEIVAMQQTYATVGGVKEMIDVVSVVEDSLQIYEGALLRHEVEVVRDFESVPPVNMEKSKILQILVNLLSNAKYACLESQRPDKVLTLCVRRREDRVEISVRDNGVGISPENLTRIFNHGFTTRKDGHGFGLHSSALAAKEMGGRLRAGSEGPGQGAVFTLDLPCPAEEVAYA